MKRRIGIEALLAWAYRQELPKGPRAGTWGPVSRSAWDAILRYGELLTLIDETPNAYGCIGTGIDDDVPHPDAVLVAAEVAALANLVIDVPAGYDVLSDIAMLTEAERIDCNEQGFLIARAKGQQLSALVMRRAMIGNLPAWQSHGEVKRKTVRGPNGKDAWFRTVQQPCSFGGAPVPLEVDGIDVRKRRPFKDAYRKTFLSPNPSLLAGERFDYQAWAIALRHLAEKLDGRLAGHTIDVVDVPVWP